VRLGGLEAATRRPVPATVMGSPEPQRCTGLRVYSTRSRHAVAREFEHDAVVARARGVVVSTARSTGRATPGAMDRMRCVGVIVPPNAVP